MTRTFYIRIVYDYVEGGPDRLTGYALCTTDGPLLVDEQILGHFPPEATGKEMRLCGLEFHGADEVVWGKRTIANKVDRIVYRPPDQATDEQQALFDRVKSPVE